MTVEQTVEALNKIKEYVKNRIDDPAQQTHYIIALNTAVKELLNYDRLLDEMISEHKNRIVQLTHEISIQSLRFKLFREGGDYP